MTETRGLLAQAINIPSFGSPEILVVNEQWDPDTGQWMPGKVLARTDWPQSTDGVPLVDRDLALAKLGYRTQYGEEWEPTDYGSVAIITPFDYSGNSWV
jgi:hypothetical protein